jgi:hypothetical protein
MIDEKTAKALNAYLIEIKRELKGEERRGFALCIQEVAEWVEKMREIQNGL